MFRFPFGVLVVVCGVCLASGISRMASGQLRAPQGGSGKETPAGKVAATPQRGNGGAARKRVTTLIAVELVTGDEGAGLKAQRWSQTFEKLDATFTVRRSTPKDKLGVTERKTGESLRQVMVVGRLEPSGRIVFGERAFGENDVAKLGAWFDELREFGAQGAPEGRPAWGLSRAQFEAVHGALARPLTADPRDGELVDALKLFEWPADLPIRLTEGAAARLKEQEETRVGQSLGGISQGTALAVMLSEHGLGFFPKRLPDGSVQLTIDLLADLREPWPAGWPLQQPGPNVAPRMFAFTQIDLEAIELDAVLQTAEDFIGMPILVDRGGLAAKEIDLSQIKVSHPLKRTTWGLALRNLMAPAKTKYELLADEAGHPFLWVSPVTTPRRSTND